MFSREDFVVLFLDMYVACPFSLMLNDLSISPMYFIPHEQGTMYTHFCWLGFTRSLAEFMIFLIVLRGVKAILILCLFRIFDILSVVPFMYGKENFGISKVLFTFFLFRVCWMFLLMVFLLYIRVN